MNKNMIDASVAQRSKLRMLALALAGAALSSGALAVSKTYTLDADFGLGLLENVNFAAPNNNQLQVNLIGVGSKFLFIANHDEDSVSKYDTELNREVARYKTFAGAAGVGNGGQPSRIAIDVDGNAYVLNRMSGSTAPPFLMKILVDTALDRNSNGVIDTSAETNGTVGIQAAEMKTLTTNTNAGIGDERVAWIASIGTGTSFGRSLCIAPDGKLWVGIWNQARYYRVDPSNGATLPIGPSNLAFVQLSGWNPYGCTVDKDGILWSATLTGALGRVDTNTGAFSRLTNPYSASNYGIAQGNGKIYQAPYNANYGWAAYDPVANTWSRSTQSYAGAGIAIDGAGNIISTDYNGVKKFAASGTLLWDAPQAPGTGTAYGVMIDGNNDVWVMNLSGNSTSKHNGVTGALIGVFPTGRYPYVYTDGSGLTTKNTTNNKQGTWTVVYDGSAAATAWGKVNWNDLVPTGGAVEVSTRAADTQAALDLQGYVPTAKNANLTQSGRFIQIRTRLISSDSNESPILYDLTVSSAVASCDVDSDGDVDSVDIARIRAGIGQTPTANDPRDSNGDGLITINDARVCALKCTRAQCAP